MTCPECQIGYDPEHWDCCPHCGAEHESSGAMELSGVMRTSTILIAAGHGEPKVYRSIDDVPEPLRWMLVASTNSLNSGTVYIADQGGREQISRSLRNLPVAPNAVSVQPERTARQVISLSALWLALLIAAFSGAIAWLAGHSSW